MSFYRPSDPSYLSAKDLKRGKTTLDPVYDRFISRFTDEFGFAPLALETGCLERVGGRVWPRLDVTLERSEQCRGFLDDGPTPMPEPQAQRRVAGLLVDAMAGVSLRRLFDMPRTTPLSYPWRQQMYVDFGDFEQVAKREALDAVGQEELDGWVHSLGLGDRFWCTQRGSQPIVFVHTDAQADELRASEAPREWADRLFALARSHDEFGYLVREEIEVRVDSKQNFDERHQGSWYHYFK